MLSPLADMFETGKGEAFRSGWAMRKHSVPLPGPLFY
jgi:hypothetical protein